VYKRQPYLDFLLLNREEALTLTQSTDIDDNFWKKLKKLGAKISAVTDGRNGAYVLTADDIYFSPIINTKPVDETGAGDSFGSAFVAALNHDLSPQEALFWGVKNSASVVSYLGAKAGLLTLRQIR
jgi:sugar/nucleoside kinase (ribokinase family)